MTVSGVMSKKVRIFACALMVGLMGSNLISSDSAEARRASRGTHNSGGGYAPPSAQIVVDGKTGEVMFSENPDAPRYPASITKVMTLFLLFDELQRGTVRLDSDLTASAFSSRQAPSKIGLRPGEKISVEDAIKAVVTKSANDVAVTIAENIGGSEEAFALRMTAKARRLGMNRTSFANASGLPNVKQVTTARDLATLGRAIQEQHPQLYRYFTTRSFTWKGHRIGNHNRLIGRIQAVDGIKTGFIRASGFNLLTSAKEDNRHVVAVVLGGRSASARDSRMQQLVLSYLPRASRGARTAPVMADASAERDIPASIRPAVVAAAALPLVPAPASQTAQTTTPLPVAAPTSLKADASASLVPAPNPHAVTSIAVVETSPSAAQRVAQAISTTTPNSGGMRWVSGPQPSSTGSVPVAYTNTATGISTPASAPQVIKSSSPDLPEKSQDVIVKAAAPVQAPSTISELAAANYQTSVAVKTVSVAPIDLNEMNQLSEPAPASTAKVEPQSPVVEQVSAPAAKNTPPAPARSGWFIQIGATDNAGGAEQLLESARNKAGQVLASAEPFTEPVAKGDATLYRARFAGFNEKTAQAACKALKKNSISCFTIKN
jgi:D-alanyl-D-alanine carboxypeptidase